MIKEFRGFIMHEDVLSLAVGVVIGSAFISIVDQVAQGLITPLTDQIVAMVTGASDLEEAFLVLDRSPTKDVTFTFGNVTSAIVTFLITSFVLLLVVKVANRAKNLRAEETEEEVEEAPTAEDYLSDICGLLTEQVAKDNTHPIERTDLSDASR